MISVENAIRAMAEAIAPNTETMTVPLGDARGKIVAQDIFAPIDVPSFPRSAMDGYAVCSEDLTTASPDTPVVLQVREKLFAGDCPMLVGEPGTAARIMTGAMIPEGYDAVIKQEYTDQGEEEVRIYESIAPYRNYMKIGEDLLCGTLLVTKGTLLRSAHIGLLANVGLGEVAIVRPLRITLLVTGSELQMPGTAPVPGKIYNTLQYQIGARIEERLHEPCRTLWAPDDVAGLKKEMLDGLADADCLITTGGVSVGEHDLIPEVLEQMGADLLFRGVAMKPGTPVTAAVLDDKLILCLSGNPFAALVNLDVLFWPSVDAYYRSDVFALKRADAVVKEGTMKSSRLPRYLRAKETDGKLYFRHLQHGGSQLFTLTESNCLIRQPVNMELKEGDRVEIFHLGGPQ